MWIKHIKAKVNLALSLVRGYTSWLYFRLYNELPTWFIIEPLFIISLLWTYFHTVFILSLKKVSWIKKNGRTNCASVEIYSYRIDLSAFYIYYMTMLLKNSVNVIQKRICQLAWIKRLFESIFELLWPSLTSWLLLNVVLFLQLKLRHV